MATPTKEVTMRQRRGTAVEQAEETVEAAMAEMTAEDVEAMVAAQLWSAYEQAKEQAQVEIAEPEGPFQWDVLLIGPIQPGAGIFPFAGPPLLPNQIIRTGERAFVVGVAVLGFLATAVLTPFKLPISFEYNTGELKKWQPGPLSLQRQNTHYLAPNVPFVIDVFEFVADQAGLYEMNLCSRILDCYEKGTPPFSGFARQTTKIEPIVFLGQPSTTFDTGLKFQVYD